MLCNWFVQLILKYENGNELKFVANNSQIAKKILREFNLIGIEQNTVILIKNNLLYKESDAAIEVLSQLRFPLNTLTVFRFVPKVIRDTIYRIIARNRNRLFGQSNSCVVLDSENRTRFILD